jgi:outer membrane protein TolC
MSRGQLAVKSEQLAARKSMRRLINMLVVLSILSFSALAQVQGDTRVLDLSLPDAMQRAAQNNTRVLLALEKIKEAKGESLQSAANILPQVSGYLLQERMTYSLARSGYAGTTPDLVVGPFNHFEARAQIVENVFNLSSIDSVRAAHVNVKKMRLQQTLAEQQAAWQAALAYLNLLQKKSSLYGYQSDVKRAEDLAQLARDQRIVGLARVIDQIRAETQLSYAKTFVLQAKTLVAQAELSLKKIIGLPFDTPIHLTDTLAKKEAEVLVLETAINQAFDKRVELKVAQEELLGKTLEHKSAWKEQLPSLTLSGNYGNTGTEYDRYIDDTYQMTAQLNVPIFDGGKTIGRAQETLSAKRQAKILLDDLKKQVEMDVRLANETFKQMRSQLGTTWQAYDLAQREMTQVRDQYVMGVGNSLDVVTAETRLTQAREAYHAAQAQYRAAWVNWEYAVGSIDVGQYFGGKN